MKFLTRSLCVGVLCTAALMFLPPAGVHPQAGALPIAQHLLKLDGLLRTDIQQHAGEKRRVLIRTKPSDRLALKQQLESQGHSVLGVLDSGDTLSVVVPVNALESVAKLSRVLGVSSDALVLPSGQLLGGLVGGVTGVLDNTVKGLLGTVGYLLDPSLDEGGEPVPPAVLRATLGLQNAGSGKGVVVAVIDSGLEMSSEFQGRVKAFYDFTDGKSSVSSPSDEYGHGTHVAGTIAGSGALSRQNEYRALASSVDLVVLKVLDSTGAGYTSDVVRAIDFAVANRSKFGIDIINLSLGHPIYEPASTDPLVQAVERASKAGIIVLAAAGNLGVNPTTGLPGYAGITSPGNAP
jgi:subtilisin family serine protease